MCATIVGWICAHGAEGSLALFFDVSPPQPVREELLSQWAAGSKLRVHVGDHHASELQGLDKAAFTMDWGFSWCIQVPPNTNSSESSGFTRRG
jgi:hypothetical protein